MRLRCRQAKRGGRGDEALSQRDSSDQGQGVQTLRYQVAHPVGLGTMSSKDSALEIASLVLPGLKGRVQYLGHGM